MTALVTGACGFVGLHMVRFLIKRGYRVVSTDHHLADTSALPEGAEHIPADITRPGSLSWLKGRSFEKVFHIAAVFDYMAPWEKLYEVNCAGTRNLLEALLPQKENIRSIVVWSSGSVYGSNFGKEPVNETVPTSPINLYEKSKLEQEKIALEFHRKHGLPVVIVRPSAIYGPGSRYGIAVPAFMINKGLLRFIPGSGDYVGTFVHVDDVVGSAEFLSGIEKAVGETFNVSDDSPVSMEEALKFLALLLKKRIFSFHFPMCILRMLAVADKVFSGILRKRPILERDLLDYLSRHFWMDNTKLKSTGYRFRYPDFEVGLKDTMAWYRKEGWV